MILAYDCETSRFPDGNPYRASAKLVSWSAGNVFGYYTDPDFTTALQEILNQTTLLIVINGKFDIGWARRVGCTLPDGVRVWDCQIAEYVLSGQTKAFASMDSLCELYGISGKAGGLEEFWNAGIETADIPRGIVEAYNLGDTSRTLQIYQSQLKDSRMTPALHKLILLQGLDLLGLQEMEENGILYDKQGSITKGDEVEIEIASITKQLQETIQFEQFNLSSGDHLSCLLYGGTIEVDLFTPVELVYKSGPRKGQTYTQNRYQETIRREFPGLFKPLKGTQLKKEGYYSTAEPILRQLPCRTKAQKHLIGNLLRLGELQKQVGSFLHALPKLIDKSGWENNIIHPEYNQCVARTGRLSCSKPNAQQWDDVTSKFWISRYPSG